MGSASKSMSEMNSGLGVFSYLGHGSGTAWNTPSISVDDLDELTNTDMPFFEIDVSCLNGGFRGKRCMGEALITSEGGAIATMMHAPFARGYVQEVSGAGRRCYCLWCCHQGWPSVLHCPD